jgi:hypothetical protein
MTTAKAMMINSASPYPFTGNNSDLTRTHQGWGRADVRRLYDLRERFFIVNETDVLGNLQSRAYQLQVDAGTAELRATMVYADPAGTPNSTRHRINDLTLRVVAPNGTVYWGNNGLRNGNVSTAAGIANVVDTVENVWVSAPAAGTWTIEVQANELVQDQHRETPELDADFALVVSGVTAVPPCAADFNGDGFRNPDDLADFVTCFYLELAQPGTCAGADFNGDGFENPDDIADFITLFFVGC